ncbi:MAG: YeeE/YedE family protein [Pseudomonadota bacterium]|nr:YeeE/YedE family protein [Pseudomonadota bacterium]
MSQPAALAPIVVALAFLVAALFGAVAQRVSFCTMGAVSDIVSFGDFRRMRMWLLAITVAIAGATALQAAGLVDLGKTIYTGPRVSWLSHLTGGFLFGFGMTLASGCGSKTLLRVGAGNLKSLIVLVFLGLSAYMTLKGLFAVLRVNALDPVRFDVSALGATTSDLPSIAAAIIGPGAKTWLPILLTAGLGAFIFANRDFRQSREMVIGGILIGAIIVGGWYISGHLGYVPEDPNTLEERFVATNSGRAESYSFTAPVAYLLELLLFWSDQSRVLTFGIAGVLGMIIGSGAMALATHTFRWEGFTNTDDLVHHILGGILMGFGGVTALGCTIGQGLTGISTLAVGSFLALGAIIAGSAAAVKYQVWRVDRED